MYYLLHRNQDHIQGYTYRIPRDDEGNSPNPWSGLVEDDSDDDENGDGKDDSNGSMMVIA